MKHLITYFLLLASFAAFGQQNPPDSIALIDVFGTYVPVKKNTALTLGELKKELAKDPEVWKAFKRARRTHTLAVTVEWLSIVPFVIFILSESNTEMLISIGATSALTATHLLLIEGPYNKRLKHLVELHNQQVKLNAK